MFVTKNCFIDINDPYVFRLLVLGRRSYVILEAIFVRIKNVDLMDLSSFIYPLSVLTSKWFNKKKVTEMIVVVFWLSFVTLVLSLLFFILRIARNHTLV